MMDDRAHIVAVSDCSLLSVPAIVVLDTTIAWSNDDKKFHFGIKKGFVFLSAF